MLMPNMQHHVVSAVEQKKKEKRKREGRKEGINKHMALIMLMILVNSLNKSPYMLQMTWQTIVGKLDCQL